MTDAVPIAGAAMPVAEGLFQADASGPRLIGSRCAGCATLYFPEAFTCRNPDCYDKRPVRELLPDRGALESFTIQRYRPPPLFRMDDWSPYGIGLIDLGQGLKVMGMLTDHPPETFHIGMAVRIVIEKLYTDEDRGPVLTYKFAPLEAGQEAR